MAAALVISKVLAIYAGPAGLAVVGQFQNIVQLFTTFSRAGVDTGVTKYTAEYSDSPDQLYILFSTTFKIVLLFSFLAVVSLIIGSNWLSGYFFKTPNYQDVFLLFALTIFLCALNGVCLAILNGLGHIRTFVTANILQSLIALALTVVLVTWLGLKGALYALVLNQSVVFLLLLLMLRKHPTIRIENFTKPFDRVVAAKLLKYSLMAAVTSILAPLVATLIRQDISHQLSSDHAGYWQGMWYISSIFTTVVTTSLTVYYLPKIASLHNASEIRMELLNGYMIVMPIIIVVSFVIYLMRDWVITLLFTPEFAPIQVLFMWQLVGDVIKISSWIMSYLMLAKAMTIEFISTEILFSATFVVLCMYLTRQFGLVGLSYAYAINYSIYFCAVALITRPVWSK